MIKHNGNYKYCPESSPKCKLNLNFPNDSNCVGCFHKPKQQLRKNWDDNPLKMQWFAEQEAKKRKWKQGTSYFNIQKIGLQSDFIFGGGSSCNSGGCHD